MTPPTSSQPRPTWLIGLGVAVVIVCCLGSGLILTGVGGYFFFSARTRTIRPIATTAPIATASAKATQASTKSPTTTPALTAAPAAEEIEVPIEGFQHVPEGSSITYNHYPPSSGKHYPSPAPWGVYTDPVPEGTFVHNLEHSGIVILYHCPDGCPDLEQQLSDFYDQAPKDPEFGEVKILITPYARELPATMVALAWGWQLNLSEVDEARLLDFYQRHLNQGPEIIP
jgi:hypothetical protein